MEEIDARGLACPAPVLQTKAAVEQEGASTVRVIVDNEASQQNVGRFLESQGFETVMEKTGEDFLILGSRQPGKARHSNISREAGTETGKIVVLFASDRMGYGDDELGMKLMVNFIKTLKEMGPALWRLIFVNNGVKLTIGKSEVLPILKQYEENNIHILVCGTCLQHFNLLDQKQVGETTNMLDIVTAMQLADKVITI